MLHTRLSRARPRVTHRQQLNASLASSGGGKLSLNDFVIKVSGFGHKKTA